jgi:DNA-binding LytR/AlgR family response regulator
MKQEIKIGIVEDELLIAEKIRMILTEIGYFVCEPVSGYDGAIEMFKNERPDIVLLDINLGGEKDGISIAQTINEEFHFPFIFLTAHSDGATIERAKGVKPYAYLVKPFTKEELFAAIEIAFNNYSSNKQVLINAKVSGKNHDFIFVREGHRFIKIIFDDIAYIESRENYVIIHTKDKKNITLRSTFNEFLSQLPAERFCRTHRSFAVQTGLIENIDNADAYISGMKVPVSSTYRDTLLALLGIR